MSIDDYLAENQDYEPPRDEKIDEVKSILLSELFDANPAQVYYQRQVEILFERRFFHWITAKALNELANEGVIGCEERQRDVLRIKFYWSRRNRYWRRRADKIEQIVARFSDSSFTYALGRQGELLFDAALPKAGFMPRGEDVKSYNGLVWTKTNHNLDRVFVRDGVHYGVEYKNTLSYIDRRELEVKLEICDTLKLVPLFIMRMAPASYIELIQVRGGFALIFEWQLYPFFSEDFAKEVREELGIKVDSPRSIAEGTIQRVVKWHENRLLGDDLV